VIYLHKNDIVRGLVSMDNNILVMTVLSFLTP